MSIEWLFEVIEDRKKNPSEKSYTSHLIAEGLPRIAQKVGEEGTEVVVAALAQDDQRLIEEVADLTFHTLVLLSAHGLNSGARSGGIGKTQKMTKIVLLDIDGVLVHPGGYRAALRATVNHFIEPPLVIPEEVLTDLENRGISSEWDMAPLLLASYWTDRLSHHPIFNLPRMLPPQPPRSTASAKKARLRPGSFLNFHWFQANTLQRLPCRQDIFHPFHMVCEKIC